MSPTDPPASARDAAARLLALGYAPVPIPPRLKGPRLPEWEALRLTPELLDTHFPAGRDMNVGVLLGEPSGGLVDVDLDSPEARAAAPFLLPDTGMVSGRASAPQSHYWYVVDAAPRKSAEDFDDPSDGDDVRKHLLELRSTGGQTVLPPSVYPAEPRKNKPREERCVWHRPGPAARVPTADLLPAVRRTAAAALLGRHWSDARNKRAMALAGGLLRAGWSADQAEVFVRAVAAAAGDEEPDNRADTVAHTAKAIREGKNVTGWPKLAALLGAAGEAFVTAVVGWLGIQFGPKVTVGGGTGGAAGRPKAGAPFAPLPAWTPFPVEHLPAALRDFTLTVSAAMRCDPTYVALPALAACAGMIGSTRQVRLKKSWCEPAMVWAVVVGDSGTLKTPPYKRAVAPVVAYQHARMKEHQAAMVEYRAELRAYERERRRAKDADPGDPPAEPKCVRLYTRDTTVEALAALLEQNQTRFLIGRDELSGWLASFNQYKAKGGSDQANFLELHSLGTLVVDRKTGDHRTTFVNGVGVSICGGIQPGVLRDALSPQHFSAGIPARLLFAYPPRRPKEWTEDDIDEAAEAAYQKLVAGLTDLKPHTDEFGDPFPVTLGLAPDAKAAWVAFYRRFAHRQADTKGDLAAAFSKLEGYAARLALVHHVCQSVHAGEIALDAVPLASVRAGIALAEWFTAEAERVYHLLGEEHEEAETRKLVETVNRLAARNGGRLTAKLLQRSNQRRYRTAEAAAAALESLVGHGVGQWADAPSGPAGGRPTRFFIPCVTYDETDETPSDGGGETPPDDRSGGDESGDDTQDGVTKPPDGGSGGAGVNPELIRETEGAAECGPGVSSVSSYVTHANGEQAQAPDDAPPVARGSVTHVSGVSSPTPYTLITDPAGLPLVLAALEDTAGPVGLDTETTGLNPAADRVRLLQLATERDTFVVDLFAVPDPADLAPLFEHLAGREVVGHHLKFDLQFLARLGFVPGPVFDTLLASQVLHAGERAATRARLKYGLGEAVARELGRDLSKAEQASDWAGPLTDAQLAYAAADAAVLLPLAESLKEKLAAADLVATAALEMRAVPGVAAAVPVAVDVAAWTALAADAEAEERRVMLEMNALVPNPTKLFTDPEFGGWNWNSPDQVKAAFRVAGVELASTGDAVLACLDHPLAALLRKHRAAATKIKAFGRNWLAEYVVGGEVAASWQQMGQDDRSVDTGRMSCTGPNLQQVPRGTAYRKCLVARPGCVLVKADYSQIELRIAAVISGDRVMSAAYRDGKDLHTLTAASITGKAEADVAKADRQLAKAVNFGLLYGQGANGLVGYAKKGYGVTLTVDEAEAHRAAFFRAYPDLRRWQQGVERGVKRLFHADPAGTQETRTRGGRRRTLPVAKTRGDGTPYPNVTDALNTPVQGTGADGLKAAIALLWERRAECPHAVPVIFCHDEVVVEVRAEHAPAAAAWLERCMLDGMTPFVDPVPVAVEVTVGPTWGG